MIELIGELLDGWQPEVTRRHLRQTEGTSRERAAETADLALGTALSSISLTIPAVLVIGFITGRTIILGLEPTSSTLLALTLVVSIVTFAFERTNVLLGAVHVLLFLAYLMLIFAN